MSAASETTQPPALDPGLLERLGRDPLKRIDAVIAHFRRTRQPVLLFEAIKMKTRLSLGLAMVPHPDESASLGGTVREREVERALEEGLLDACRQAGAMLIQDGKIAEGYMYLRPIGDQEMIRRLLADVEITEDNYDEMVHVLLHEGIDLGRGYSAVIERQGTCNSITLFDQTISQRSRRDRQVAAACLLRHFYDELFTLVQADFRHRGAERGLSIEQIEKDVAELNLGELIARHGWILSTGGYHLDTTHLSATVRMAGPLEQPELIDKAIQLCQYGRRLPPEFQYPGEEPFVEFYPNHLAFFHAMVGRDVAAATRLFGHKARTVDVATSGSGAIETYIELLDRTGRPGEALRAAMELFPADVPIQRVMGDLLALAGRARDAGDASVVDELERFCFDRGDLLGVAAIGQLRGGSATPAAT